VKPIAELGLQRRREVDEDHMYDDDDNIIPNPIPKPNNVVRPGANNNNNKPKDKPKIATLFDRK
jgi:hypothetical protein